MNLNHRYTQYQYQIIGFLQVAPISSFQLPGPGKLKSSAVRFRGTQSQTTAVSKPKAKDVARRYDSRDSGCGSGKARSDFCTASYIIYTYFFFTLLYMLRYIDIYVIQNGVTRVRFRKAISPLQAQEGMS
jgi:hypothetical protein